MNRLRTADLVFAICATSLVGACDEDDPTSPPLTSPPAPTKPNLEGTWRLEPRLELDCGVALMVLDTIKTRITAPGVMTFTVKGRFTPSLRVLERSTKVTLSARNGFNFHVDRTYSYGSFRFTLVGQFSGSNSFSAVASAGGQVQSGTHRISCEGRQAEVVGSRVNEPSPDFAENR